MKEPSSREKELLKEYLDMDSGRDDATSVLFTDRKGTARIYPEEDCVLSGLEAAGFVFGSLGCKPRPTESAESGGRCERGKTVMDVEGGISGLLKGERVALNILSRMSGIATRAREASDLAEEASRGTRVAGTRKTTPGFSVFEKRALIDGGALPHRLDLAELAMVKDNHIAAMGGGPEAVRGAVLELRKIYGPYKIIEIEVEDVENAVAGVNAGANIIMIDNRSPEECGLISRAVRDRAGEIGRNVSVEASGGIDVDDIVRYAPHVDVISMGRLTYDYHVIGFKMEISGR